MNEVVKFLPHNPQEFENDMRALIMSHMGLGQGNPTQWVVSAVCEAYQRGFGAGFAAAGTYPAPPCRVDTLALRVYDQADGVRRLPPAELIDTNDPRN